MLGIGLGVKAQIFGFGLATLAFLILAAQTLHEMIRK